MNHLLCITNVMHIIADVKTRRKEIVVAGCIQKWWTGSGFHPSPLAGEGAGERGDSVAAAKIVANTPSKLLMIS
ncbi:MAG: hypothetical protein Q7J38_07855, partial [Gallionella sp.]|nr:hypothetical protein [Gallionella sp.]